MESNKLYVGNLNYAVVESQLEELFAQYGEVKSVRIIGRKGFGFVEMGTAEEANAAREALNNTEFEGRTMRVDSAHPRKERNDF